MKYSSSVYEKREGLLTEIQRLLTIAEFLLEMSSHHNNYHDIIIPRG